MELDIAICDDEKYARKLIRNLIEKQGIRCKVTEFSSGKELLEVLRQKAVDILFLDVSMEGMDGMAVAKQLRSQAGERGEAVWGSLPLLIFVTGYPEYMMDAFSVNAFQFLVKPIKESFGSIALRSNGSNPVKRLRRQEGRVRRGTCRDGSSGRDRGAR